jgi:methionyl-tRNA synthetase
MQNKPFYITTTLPYVNSDPHVGFAMEIVRADVIARYKRLFGYDVFFNTGTDEHGAKIYENAVNARISPQEYVDGYAGKFKELVTALNISDVHFIRTTDEKHLAAAQEMWKRCKAAGDIYKKLYKVKYCVGCELEKTDSDLVDNKCPLHPTREIEIREEENYFFKFSHYQEKLLAYYEAHPDFVIPDFRYNEIKAFVSRGLEDFSISRLKSKMPWGVSVPGDDEHVMYVWFDALTSYISTLGWGGDEKDFSFWKEGSPVQYCGKDNLRQQSAMWQAMLMSAGLTNSSHIIIDGFITSGGAKMSKSVGNVISPFDVINAFKEVTDYPEDVLRFVLLHDISSFEDGDITMESIKESYQAHLANGIGNLTSRIMKMATTHVPEGIRPEPFDFPSDYVHAIESFDIRKAIECVMKEMNMLDEYIQHTEPFKVIKVDVEKGRELIEEMRTRLYNLARLLQVFMPKTSDAIKSHVKNNTMPEKPLFNRLA